MKIARRYYFTGQVQGVGFRYTTASLAQDYPVAGFVRNLNDGRVELHVEATMADIERFVSAIQEHFRKHIQAIESSDQAVESFRTFFIQRDNGRIEN